MLLVMRFPATFGYLNPWRFGDKLFDLHVDPGQMLSLADSEKTLHYAQAMRAMMQAHDAPSELYARFELDTISATREAAFAGRWSRLNVLAGCEHHGVEEALRFLLRAGKADGIAHDDLLAHFPAGKTLREADIFTLIDAFFSGDRHRALVYQTRLLLRTE